MMIDHSTHLHDAHGVCTMKGAPRVYRYTDSIQLPKKMTLETAEIVSDKIREVGETRDCPQFLQRIDFVVEAESEWELRDILADLQQELALWAVEFDPNHENVEQVRARRVRED